MNIPQICPAPRSLISPLKLSAYLKSITTVPYYTYLSALNDLFSTQDQPFSIQAWFERIEKHEHRSFACRHPMSLVFENLTS